MHDSGIDLLASLEEAKQQPHILDDATIAGIKHVYDN